MDSLVSRIEEIRPFADVGETCTVHRDFYEKQFAYSARTITLLDLDTLARGNPALDLGNLLAHLYLARLVETDATDSAAVDLDDLSASLVSHYRTCGGSVSDNALQFFSASSLCRLGAVHAARSETGRYTDLLWQQANDVLSGGAG
jgi:aminoglycoside phosphotransferase (APT) family kinase protein